MRKLGLTTLEASAAPPGITVVKGEWPGIRLDEKGGGASAGPTGVPWLDSNGWQARLARIRRQDQPVWITTGLPKERILRPVAYLIALADAAMYGGRWVMELAPDLSSEIAAGQARDTWGQILAAQRFFAAHRAWDAWRARGIVGILSDFAGQNEFAAGELLNLTARLHQPYRILAADRPWAAEGLQAIVYADAGPLPPDLRKKLLDFVQSGGLLITGAKSGISEGAPAAAPHPRYSFRTLGKGRIALGDLADPYEAAGDSQILLSHRRDVVRFWNGGSLGSYFTGSPDGKTALLQIINYAGRPGADPVSVRVAGPYREARIQLLADAAPQPLKAVQQKEAIELHLPAIPVYAAIELI
jgi:hypothetical protein